MITYQIIHSEDFNLRRKISERIGGGKIKAFESANRGTKLYHAQHNGWITIDSASAPGVTSGKVNSRVPEGEDRILGAFISLLRRHFPEKIHAINLQFREP